MIQKITISGQPGHKGRPRFTRSGHVYTPAMTKAWENRVRASAVTIQMISEGAISVVIVARFQTLKSDIRKRDPRPVRWKTTKPDSDNIEKGVLDALNGIAWSDDALICAPLMLKQFAAQGEDPHTIVVFAPAVAPQEISNQLTQLINYA